MWEEATITADTYPTDPQFTKPGTSLEPEQFLILCKGPTTYPSTSVVEWSFDGTSKAGECDPGDVTRQVVIDVHWNKLWVKFREGSSGSVAVQLSSYRRERIGG